MLRLFHISLFRHEQNVHNILSKRVKDISKQYLLILCIIVRYVHNSKEGQAYLLSFFLFESSLQSILIENYK